MKPTTDLSPRRLVTVCFTGDSGLTDYSVSFSRAAARRAPTTLVTGTSLDPLLTGHGVESILLFRRSRYFPIDYPRFLLWWFARRRNSFMVFQGPLKVPLVESVFVRLLGVLGGKSAVVVHDVVPHNGSAWARRCLHEYYRSFRHVVFHTPAAREALANVTGGTKKSHVVVPHGLYDIFDNDSGSRREAIDKIKLGSDSKPILLVFGNIEQRKGIVETIAAHKLLKQRGYNFHVVVAGREFEGPSTSTGAAIRSAKTNPDITVRADRVPFDDVKHYFRSADVVLLPYHEGSTSGVLKLALAFGKPVVASRVGDLANEVNDDLGVLLPESWTATDLADAILDVYRDLEGFADRIAVVQSRYDWQTVADRVISLSCTSANASAGPAGADDSER